MMIDNQVSFSYLWVLLGFPFSAGKPCGSVDGCSSALWADLPGKRGACVWSACYLPTTPLRGPLRAHSHFPINVAKLCFLPYYYWLNVNVPSSSDVAYSLSIIWGGKRLYLGVWGGFPLSSSLAIW